MLEAKADGKGATDERVMMILHVAMLTVLLMMVPMVLLVMTTAMQDSEHNVMRHRSQSESQQGGSEVAAEGV